jgi:hypothetical protein
MARANILLWAPGQAQTQAKAWDLMIQASDRATLHAIDSPGVVSVPLAEHGEPATVLQLVWIVLSRHVSCGL